MPVSREEGLAGQWESVLPNPGSQLARSRSRGGSRYSKPLPVTNTQPVHRQHAIDFSREKGEQEGKFLEKSSKD